VILIIDHYDSFSHNLYQLFASQFDKVCVRRCDDIGLAEIKALNPKAIVLSPGPGTPRETGVTMSLLRSAEFEQKPIIGVCLGFQAMMECAGAKVDLAPEVVHGKTVSLKRPSHTIFSEQNEEMELARYHSLVVYENTLPKSVNALLVYNKMVMAAELKSMPRLGFQFHPESFLTCGGPLLVKKTMAYLRSKISV